MKFGFLVDLNGCIGCKACEVACKAENSVHVGTWRLRVQYVDDGLCPKVKRNSTPMRCNACPTEANLFGDLDDPKSRISQYIASHRDVRVRKVEKGTKPSTSIVAGGASQLEPLSVKREEGMSLFDRIGTLDKVGGHWAPVYLFAARRNAQTTLYRDAADATLQFLHADFGALE